MNYTFDRKIIRICIIGAGRAGSFHVNSLSINKQYELLYVIDKDETKAIKLAERAQCKFNSDLDWVLNNIDFDAVIIATTTPTHYELTMKCLTHNKHVFCEKPLGKTEDEITNCFKLANSNNLKLLIAYQKRFDKNYSKLIELLKNKSIKNIRMVTRDHPLPPMEYLNTSNGIVEDMMSHDIDMANVLMKFTFPQKVIAFSNTDNKDLKNNNEIENIEIMLQYEDGTIISFNGSRDAKHGYDQRVEAFGDFGMIQMENQIDDTIKYYTNSCEQHSKMNYSFPERYNESYVKELDYFYKMIVLNYGPLVEESHLILTKKICNGINESIKTNKIYYFESQLRHYLENTPQYFLYRDMHINQTIDYVKCKYKQYSKLNNSKMNMIDALTIMNEFIDPSDPDVDIENSTHAYQTAERIRKKYPNNYELQIVGLIHDLGKVLFKFGEPTWAVVGDTYVVGCKFPETIVYYETMKLNPDYNDIRYNTTNGIYQEKCGLNNLLITFGHDEYLYQVLKQNKNHKLSEIYMNVIRYHSFYPWHTGKSYHHFMNDSDKITLQNVLEFNKFDLYSKEDIDFVLTDEIKAYYNNLLNTYFPETLQW